MNYPEIICAAIQLKDGRVFRGANFDMDWTPMVTFNKIKPDIYSHGGIIEQNNLQDLGSELDEMVPGFIGSDDKFYNRENAYLCAIFNEQIPQRDIQQLFSEDFWFWS